MENKSEQMKKAEDNLDIVIQDLEGEVKEDGEQETGMYSCIRWIYCI